MNSGRARDAGRCEMGNLKTVLRELNADCPTSFTILEFKLETESLPTDAQLSQHGTDSQNCEDDGEVIWCEIFKSISKHPDSAGEPNRQTYKQRNKSDHPMMPFIIVCAVHNMWRMDPCRSSK